jgi:hypothetical protein
MARLSEEDLERALGAAGAAGYTVDLVEEIRRLRELVLRLHPFVDSKQAPHALLDELNAEVDAIRDHRFAPQGTRFQVGPDRPEFDDL